MRDDVSLPQRFLSRMHALCDQAKGSDRGHEEDEIVELACTLASLKYTKVT